MAYKSTGINHSYLVCMFLGWFQSKFIQFRSIWPLFILWSFLNMFFTFISLNWFRDMLSNTRIKFVYSYQFVKENIFFTEKIVLNLKYFLQIATSIGSLTYKFFELSTWVYVIHVSQNHWICDWPFREEGWLLFTSFPNSPFPCNTIIYT